MWNVIKYQNLALEWFLPFFLFRKREYLYNSLVKLSLGSVLYCVNESGGFFQCIARHWVTLFNVERSILLVFLIQQIVIFFISHSFQYKQKLWHSFRPFIFIVWYRKQFFFCWKRLLCIHWLIVENYSPLFYALIIYRTKHNNIRFDILFVGMIFFFWIFYFMLGVLG